MLEPTYDDARRFAEGMAAVNVGARIPYDGIGRLGGEWGYVDTQGELLIDIKFTAASDFSSGLASVVDSMGTKVIDKAGSVVTVFRGADVGEFREGVAPVQFGNHTRYISPGGKTKFVVDGRAGEFHEGMAVFITKRYGFVDIKGRVAISPRFEEARAFSDGRAAVRIGHSWGFIDRRGNLVIRPKFNIVRPFCQGAAKVYIGGELDELYEWYGGEWWLINRYGKRLKRLSK